MLFENKCFIVYVRIKPLFITRFIRLKQPKLCVFCWQSSHTAADHSRILELLLITLGSFSFFSFLFSPLLLLDSVKWL